MTETIVDQQSGLSIDILASQHNSGQAATLSICLAQLDYLVRTAAARTCHQQPTAVSRMCASTASASGLQTGNHALVAPQQMKHNMLCQVMQHGQQR
jgi:hypothetical protein